MVVKQAVKPGVVEEAQVQAFQATLRGQIIRPDYSQYDEARSIYNGMIDKRPAFIARCANVADVIQSVNFARENRLTLAVRDGGHNGPGMATCDDGLVIDLSPMKSVRVDPVAKSARVDGAAP